MYLHPIVEQIIVEFSMGLIVALSLNIEVGFLRIPQFGRLLAVLAGAIVVASIPGRIIAWYLGLPAGFEYAHTLHNPRIVTNINNWLSHNPLASIGILILAIVLVMLIGGIIGYLCAYPALRLKGAYLGITLLTFGEILLSIATNYEPLVGGTVGVFVVDPLRFLGWGRTFMVFLIFAITIATYIYAELVARSPFGRMLKAIRDSEVAAEVYGKNAVKARSQTLIVGGAIAALAGALWALYTGSMSTSTYTRLTWTFWPWAYLMLGGVGNNLGVLIGVLLFTILRTLITLYKHALAVFLPLASEWLEYILVGLVIIVIVLFRPQGLLPERPTPSLSIEELKKIKKKLGI